MRSLFLATVLVPALVCAQVPAQLPYQGRLAKADGTPETGTVNLTFGIFAEPSSGSALWTEQHLVGLTDGYYSLLLGSVNPLAPGVFDGTLRYLQLTVGGVALMPRQAIGSIPYSLMAVGAHNVTGGTVSATRLSVAGPDMVDGTGVLNSTGTAVTGVGTSFNSELAVGHELRVGAQSRLVVAVTSNTALTIDQAFAPALTSSTFKLRKPIAEVSDSNGSPVLMINGRGDIGIGTQNPTARLEVAGTFAARFRGFSLRAAGTATTPQTKPSGWNKVALNPVATYNTFPAGSFDAANSRFIAPEDGFYRLTAGGYTKTAATAWGQRYALGFKRNGTLVGFSGASLSTTDTPMTTHSQVLQLASGDSVEVWMYSEVDLSLGLFSAGHELRFEGEFLGK